MNGGLPWSSSLMSLLYAMLGAAFLLSFIRLLRGPSLLDRVVALDLLAALTVGTTLLFSVSTSQKVLLDVAIGVALVTFVGTVAFAQYVERRRGDD